MTREEAKSELMQIYMSLSEEKKQALDVLMAQADGEYDDAKYHEEHGEVVVDKAVWEDAKRALEQEPCEDAISRNAVIQTLNKMDRYTANELTLCDTDKKFPANEVFVVDDVYEYIAEQLPSVKPQEPKTGHWIDDMKLGYHVSICSNCDWRGHGDTCLIYKPKYCPNCGAKMVEPTCDTCEYTTAAFNPCNACKDKSEYKPQESEDKECTKKI